MDTYKTCKNIVQKGTIIENVFKAPFFNDEPQLYTYSAILHDKKIPPDILGGGTSLSKRVAYIKAVMEAMERYLLIPTILERESWRNLSIKSIEEDTNTDFSKIIKFSETQLAKKQFKNFSITNKNKKVKCCYVEDIIHKRSVYYPSQFFYLPYWEKEQIFRLPISTGAATDFNRITARKKGIYEIFERDQFITSYLGKIPGHKIRLKTLPSEIKEILKEFLYYNLKVHCILLKSDIPIPTILTILEDPTKIGPLYTFGLKCSPNISTAVQGSLEEAFHSRRWLRYNQGGEKQIEKLWTKRDQISSILERGLVWSSPKVEGKLDFWINNSKFVNLKEIDIQNKTKEDSMEYEISLIEQKGWNCYIKNFKCKESEAFNIHCVKVFIPEAHPLYLDENYPYLDKKRIQEVLNTTNTIKVNNFLQPFL